MCEFDYAMFQEGPRAECFITSTPKQLALPIVVPSNYPEERPKTDLAYIMMKMAEEAVAYEFVYIACPYDGIFLDIAGDLEYALGFSGGAPKHNALLALHRPYKYTEEGLRTNLFQIWLCGMENNIKRHKDAAASLWVAKHNIQPLYQAGTRLIANVDISNYIKAGCILTISEVFYRIACYLIDVDSDKYMHIRTKYERIESACTPIK